MSEWKDPDGGTYTEQQLISEINRLQKTHDYQLIVGSDSNVVGRQFKFVTAIVLYNIGKGGVYFYTTSFEPRASFRGNNHKMRLFQEVAKSIEISDFLTELNFKVLEVHVDASPKEEKEYSSEFSDQLKGYVVASGYEPVIKPFSWAASSVANKHSR